MISPEEEPERRFLEELRVEFPEFRVVKKSEDRLSRAIDLALRALSLGRQDRYLTHYRTVIGDTLYVPDAWEHTSSVDRLICLRHERIHLRQRRRLGMLGLTVLYLFVPFPIGLAWFRARLEWEAYEETLRATFEHRGIEAIRTPAMKAAMIDRFVGPDYLWMWPFPKTIARWYDEAVAHLEKNHAS